VYLVQEKGVDASRISIYTGSTGTNVDNTTIVPAGATFDTGSYKAVPDKPVPAKKAAPARKPGWVSPAGRFFCSQETSELAGTPG
jgi:hypothetical protein